MNTSTPTTGPIAGIHTYAGDCPICGQAIMAENNKLPHLCPTCSHPLRSPNPDSPGQNICHCLRLYFDPRGRSSRREFWAFTLGAMLLLGIEGAILMLCHTNHILPSIPVLVWWILPMLIVCPFSAVTIRRLHDLGRSASQYIICLVLAILGCTGVVLHSMNVQPEFFTSAVAEWCWAALRADIILFCVILYTSTQHRIYGPNKYGPAPK